MSKLSPENREQGSALPYGITKVDKCHDTHVQTRGLCNAENGPSRKLRPFGGDNAGSSPVTNVPSRSGC